MYKHILIPTDGSEVAAKALDAGIQFAREAGARLTLFTAVPEYEPPTEGDVLARRPLVSVAEHEERSRGMADRILAEAAQRARDLGVAVDTDYAESNFPSRAIIAAAESHACDLIVMASHGRHGFAELWHGSQTQDVLTHSSIPTLVYR